MTVLGYLLWMVFEADFRIVGLIAQTSSESCNYSRLIYFARTIFQVSMFFKL